MCKGNGLKAVLIFSVILATSGCGSFQESLTSRAHETKGLSYQEKGDLAKAEEELKLAVSLAAGEPENRTGNVGRIEYEIGALYRKQNKTQEAEESYKRALVVFSQTPKLVSDADRKFWAHCLSDYAQLLRETDRAGEAEVRERRAKEMLDSLGQPEAKSQSGLAP